MMKMIQDSPNLSTRPIDILKKLQFYSSCPKVQKMDEDFENDYPPPKSTMKVVRESPDLSASPIDILNKLHTCQTHPRIQLMADLL